MYSRFSFDNSVRLQKWSDCQKNKGPTKHPSGACSRFHFRPGDTERDVERVFNAILSGEIRGR